MIDLDEPNKNYQPYPSMCFCHFVLCMLTLDHAQTNLLYRNRRTNALSFSTFYRLNEWRGTWWLVVFLSDWWMKRGPPSPLQTIRCITRRHASNRTRLFSVTWQPVRPKINTHGKWISLGRSCSNVLTPADRIPRVASSPWPTTVKPSTYSESLWNSQVWKETREIAYGYVSGPPSYTCMDRKRKGRALSGAFTGA